MKKNFNLNVVIPKDDDKQEQHQDHVLSDSPGEGGDPSV